MCLARPQALKVTLGLATDGPGAAPAPNAAAIKQQLLQLVHRVLESEAACSSVAEAGGRSSACSAGHDSALQDAAAGAGWEHAARAPLVVAALQVLSGLHGAEYKAQVLSLLPALCRLMCSSHHLTRAAVAQVLRSPEFLALLPAAAAHGGSVGMLAAAGPAAATLAGGGGPLHTGLQSSWQQVLL